MAVRASQLISERLKSMLVRDKTELGYGFKTALNADVSRVLADYFALDGAVEIAVEPTDDGGVSVIVSAKAKKILRFDSTADLRD